MERIENEFRNVGFPQIARLHYELELDKNLIELLDNKIKVNYNFVKKHTENANDNCKMSVLLTFLKNGDLDGFKYFFSEFGYVDYTMQNNLLLKYTISMCLTENRYQIIKYLLEMGANAKDPECIKLAQSMRCQGYDNKVVSKIVKLLVDNGADIHIDDEYVFRMACASFYEIDMEYIKYLVESNVNIHAGNNYAICQSVYFSNYHLCKYLIESGANVNACNGFPLRCAVTSETDIENENIIELLLDAKADINVLKMDDIFICALECNGKNLKVLTNHGFDISIINKKYSPNTDAEQVIDILERNGVDLKRFVAAILSGNYIRDM